MAKRQYNKKSDYWQKFEKTTQANIPALEENFSPELVGEPFYTSDASVKVSKASCGTRTTSAKGASRVNRAAFSQTIDRYSSIRRGLLPYEYSADGVNVRDAIVLCQKAYANISVFRNAVDIMSEFANTELFLEGGTKKSRTFFTEWFKR